MTARPALRALVAGLVLGGIALGASGCGTALALYELFKSDDESKPAAVDAAVDAAIPAAEEDAAVAVVEEDAGPCNVGARCGDAGVCSLGGACVARKSDGDPCVASWECAGGYCAWDGTAGRCESALNACKTTETGCTEEAHSCCEGARCRPAQFGAEAQCEMCAVKGTPCDSAEACCSGTCSYGKCQ